VPCTLQRSTESCSHMLPCFFVFVVLHSRLGDDRFAQMATDIGVVVGQPDVAAAALVLYRGTKDPGFALQPSRTGPITGVLLLAQTCDQHCHCSTRCRLLRLLSHACHGTCRAKVMIGLRTSLRRCMCAAVSGRRLMAQWYFALLGPALVACSGRLLHLPCGLGCQTCVWLRL
jgi:hypothetical protein